MNRSFDFGKAFGAGFSGVGGLVAPLGKLVVAYALIIGVVQGAMQLVTTKMFAGAASSSFKFTANGPASPTNVNGMIGGSIGVLLLGIVVSVIISVLVLSVAGTIFRYVVAELRGQNPREPEIGEPLQEISSYLPTWLAYVVPLLACVWGPILLMPISKPLAGLLMLVGIIGAIFLSVRWALTPIVAGVEGLSGKEATGRSSELVRGSGFMLVVLMIVMSLVIGIPAMIISAIVGAIMAVFGSAGAFLGLVVTAAVVGVVGGLIYAGTLAQVYIDLVGPEGSDGGAGPNQPTTPEYQVSQG